jgi:hypothetical protein
MFSNLPMVSDPFPEVLLKFGPVLSVSYNKDYRVEVVIFGEGLNAQGVE